MRVTATVAGPGLRRKEPLEELELPDAQRGGTQQDSGPGNTAQDPHRQSVGEGAMREGLEMQKCS